MKDYFKNLLHQSYGERMMDNKINPFSNPFTVDDPFHLSDDNGSLEMTQEEYIQCILVVLNNSQWTDKYVSVDSRIDLKSKTILKTFNEILTKIYHPKMSQNVRLVAYEKRATEVQWDFSSLICSLSKVLEIELNNSIIQWIRNKEGIEMPRYYNLVKPGFECKISDKIDLNAPVKGNERVCQTQTIGNIEVLMKIYREKMPKTLAQIAYELGRILYQIRDSRNLSSHTSVMTEKEFLDFYANFCLIMEKGWFTTLMDLKMALKGHVD